MKTRSSPDRTSRKGLCLNCNQTIIVVRHPDDALKSSRELPTEKIRLYATHLSNAGPDFMEAATTVREFNSFLSSMSCSHQQIKKPKPWEVMTA